MWLKFKKLAVGYDDYCLERFEAMLVWLNDWLSLTQRRFEYGCTVLYMVTVMLPVESAAWVTWFNATAALVIGVSMLFMMHLNRAVLRRGLVPIRLAMQGMILFYLVLLFNLSHRSMGDALNILRPAIYGLFSYSVAIRIDRDSGRRRKTAWDKAKDWWSGLFWTPPLPSPR